LSFWAIPNLYVQNRPVYVVDTSSSTTPFVLVYVGRRWYLLEIPVSLQLFLFDGNNAARVVTMYEAVGGAGQIARSQNTWWNETGTTSTHGYWNAMTPPEVVWALSDMTESYEPYGVGSDGLTWNAGKRGQAAGRSFQQMSLVCQDVNRLKACGSDIVCGTFQVCTRPNNNSSDGKCACPEGKFGEFCDNSIGACDGGR
jgi:hypothetical protein